jgi:hypothetical protein
MEKRAVVYSVYLTFDKPLNQVIHWKLLISSLLSLRKYNKDIPVIVYTCNGNTFFNYNKFQEIVKGLEGFGNLTVQFFEKNVLVNETNTYSDSFKDIDKQTVWDKVFHKWPNTINAFEKFNVDQVLFLDPDTIFHNDVNIIFDAFPADKICFHSYIDKSVSYQATKNKNAMNDGVFLLSKNHAETLKFQYAKLFHSLIDQLINSNKLKFDNEQMNRLYWCAGQLTTQIMLKKLKISTCFFNTYKPGIVYNPQPETLDATNPLKLPIPPERVLGHYGRFEILEIYKEFLDTLSFENL